MIANLKRALLMSCWPVAEQEQGVSPSIVNVFTSEREEEIVRTCLLPWSRDSTVNVKAKWCVRSWLLSTTSYQIPEHHGECIKNIQNTEKDQKSIKEARNCVWSSLVHSGLNIWYIKRAWERLIARASGECDAIWESHLCLCYLELYTTETNTLENRNPRQFGRGSLHGTWPKFIHPLGWE